MISQLRSRTLCFAILYFIAGVRMQRAAAAHALDAEAFLENGRIRVVATYSNGEPAKDLRYEVYDGLGTKLLDGEAKGEGSFIVDWVKLSRLAVILQDGAGHRTVLAIPSAGGAESSTSSKSTGDRSIAVSRSRPIGSFLTAALAGVGYILGITGILFFWLGRRQRRTKGHAPRN